ncbi:MAG: hypothetical protein HY600_04680 [Candidatus Omnitrophica bacterium]|nr:hypothetical protein [Candidatus Omnitrophota bacterium]
MKLWLSSVSVCVISIGMAGLAWAGAYDGLQQNADKNPAFTDGLLMQHDATNGSPRPAFGFRGRIYTPGQGGAHAAEPAVIRDSGGSVIENRGQMGAPPAPPVEP